MGCADCFGCGVGWAGIVITVSFLYVDSDGQVYTRSLELAPNTPLRQAINQSGLLDLPAFGEIKAWLDDTPDDAIPNQRGWYAGVFSLKKPLNYELKDGDRVEFYRPLPKDPMKQRQTKVLIERKKGRVGV